MPKPIVAIHHNTNSFADWWVGYCQENGVPYRIVNAYDSDIVDQLAEFRAFLWHFSHGFPADLMMARSVLKSAEMLGLQVFPNSATCWHFDDKVAQFYALSALGAPTVQGHVFYDRDQALQWAAHADYPKVFKLRRGSGSRNIHLVESERHARKLIAKSFGKGFRPSGTYSNEAFKIRKHWRAGSLIPFVRSLPAKLKRRWRLDKDAGYERGYAYFQDFLAGNTFDTRVTIIGRRAFAFTRSVRAGDFRASGSGMINYVEVDRRCIDIAYEVSERLGSQSTAFDFMYDEAGEPKIGEISFGYDSKAIHDCPGHWRGGEWVPGHVWPGVAIMEDILTRI